MGSVWRARHLRLPRTVAVKVLNEQSEGSEELIRRFHREAEITSRLGHPHIVEVHDFNQLEDGRSYLVMELLHGDSLRQRMRKGPPLRLDEVVRLLDQVASALVHAHRAGVVHRDLKPENIFLVDREDGQLHAKVLDFGISKLQGAQTVLTNGPSLMGTPRYMSPEQAHADTDVDARADQFALGAIGYELLVGRPAFEGETVTQVLLQVLQTMPPPVASLAVGVPSALAEAVDRALEKDREHRFPDLEQFRAALNDLGPTRSASPSFAPSSPPPPADEASLPSSPARSGSRIGTWIALGLVGVGLAGGLAFGLSQGGSGPSLVSSDAGRAAVSDTGVAPDAGVAIAVAPPAPDAGGAEDAGQPEVSADAGTEADTGVETGRRRPAPPRKMPPLLKEAERQLADGKFDAALRAARRSLREDRDSRAYMFMTLGYCGLHNLGSANAMARNLSRSERKVAKRRCRKLGIDLAD